MNELRLRIKKTILETFLYEQEFRIEEEEKEAKEALFAFIKGEAKFDGLENSKPEDIEDAKDKNDFHNEGYSYVNEQPTILITYKNKDYSIVLDIDKEYYYRIEDSSRDFPGYEEIKLKNITIKDYKIILYNEFGTEYVFTKSEIGTENFNHFEKILKRYIE